MYIFVIAKRNGGMGYKIIQVMMEISKIQPNIFLQCFPFPSSVHCKHCLHTLIHRNKYKEIHNKPLIMQMYQKVIINIKIHIVSRSNCFSICCWLFMCNKSKAKNIPHSVPGGILFRCSFSIWFKCVWLRWNKSTCFLLRYC